MIRFKRAIAMVALFILLTTSPVFAQQTDDAGRPVPGFKLERRAGKMLAAGRYGEAERNYKMALKVKKRDLGRDHREVAVTLNNLAMMHQQQDQYPEAEGYHIQALEIRVGALGLDHPEVAETLENMTALYKAQGLDAKADGLQARAQEIWDRKEDPDQPEEEMPTRVASRGPRGTTTTQRSTTTSTPEPAPSIEYAPDSWDGINVQLMDRIKFPENAELAKRALDAAEVEFGPNHPNTARSLNNLAFLYMRSGRHAESGPLYDRALKIWENTPEPDHADVALTMDNLARLYIRSGLRGRVNELNERTLAERELIPEADRPDLLKLAVIDEHTRMLGEKESEPFHFEVRSTIAGMKSFDDPYTAQILHQWAWTRYHARGQFAYAAQLTKMAVEARRTLPDQPNVLVGESLVQLARAYIAQGEFERPERLLKEALEIYEATLGPKDRRYANFSTALVVLQLLYDTHAHRANHADIDLKIWELNNAQTPRPPVSQDVRNAMFEKERRQAQISPDAVTNLTETARYTARSRNFAFALPLYKGALKLMDDEHPLYARTLKDIADLRAAQGESQLAEDLYELARLAAPNARVVDTTPKADPDSIILADSILAGSYPTQPENPEPPTRSAASIKANPERWQAFEPKIRKHIEAREYEEAGTAARAAVAYAETAYGPYHSSVAISLNLLAEVYILQGSFGFGLHHRALDIWESVPEPDSRGLQTTLNALIKHYDTARLFPQVNEINERERLLRERIANNGPPKKPRSTAPDQSTILTRPVPAQERAIANEWSELTRAFSNLYEAEDYARAEAVAEMGLQVIGRSKLPEFPNVNTSLSQLARAYTAQDKHALAEPLLQRTLTMVEEVYEPYHWFVIAAIDTLAKSYEAQGKERQALALRDRFAGEDIPISLNSASPEEEPSNEEWARAVNGAPLLTKAQKGAIFGHVDVNVGGLHGKIVEVPSLYELELEIERNLKSRGIDVDGSDTQLYVYYKAIAQILSNEEQELGSLVGISVVAELSRRGYIFVEDEIHPVIAVMARSIATGSAFNESEIDFMSYVTSAVDGLFTANGAPQLDGFDEAILLGDTNEMPIMESRLKFKEADMAHLVAALSGTEYQMDMDSMRADDPMRNAPFWAPPYVSVYGNPFQSGLAYRLGRIVLPGFTEWFPLVRRNSDWPKQTWMNALPPSGSRGDEALLHYSMSRSYANVIDRRNFFVVYANTRITHPNVLLQIGKNRFARTPAHIFTKYRLDFASSIGGISGENGMYAKIENFVKQDADDAAARMTSPWLWREALEP